MRPPFSWLCHQEPLPWRGDQMNSSVIPHHIRDCVQRGKIKLQYLPTGEQTTGVRIGVREEGFARFGGAPNLAGDPPRGAQFNFVFYT
jgi:hypothetical protein